MFQRDNLKYRFFLRYSALQKVLQATKDIMSDQEPKEYYTTPKLHQNHPEQPRVSDWDLATVVQQLEEYRVEYLKNPSVKQIKYFNCGEDSLC